MALHRAMVCALILLLAPSTLAAQQITYGATIFGGLFLPTADLVDQTTAGDVYQYGHKTGWTAGGRFALYITPRFAVDGELVYAQSDLDVNNVLAGTPSDTTVDAGLIVGSVNAVYTVLDPPLDPLAVFVSGGLGLVYRDSDDLDSPTDIAGVLGIGFRYGVSPTVDIRVDLRDYLSMFEGNIPEADSKLQNDLFVTAGVEFRFGRGG
ncbi:MAG: outer membrane beta-barrel protein [Gemmatimonadota bacterium]|nr:MAG: outer membrane beta-barrel protein [Gemmatimonadota bacterium]